ncbi:unnamed protein product, partial [Pocillopora meandrina]
NQGDPVRATASRSTDSTLSNAETLELFSHLLDLKFDQKFTAFKRDLDDKLIFFSFQKLKTESKVSSSFNFSGNKVQNEFNSSLLDAIDGAIKTISKGNLLAGNSGEYSHYLTQQVNSFRRQESRWLDRTEDM